MVVLVEPDFVENRLISLFLKRFMTLKPPVYRALGLGGKLWIVLPVAESGFFIHRLPMPCA